MAKATQPSRAVAHTRLVTLPVDHAASSTNRGVTTIMITRSSTDGFLVWVAMAVTPGAYKARVSLGIHLVSLSNTSLKGFSPPSPAPSASGAGAGAGAGAAETGAGATAGAAAASACRASGCPSKIAGRCAASTPIRHAPMTALLQV